MWSIFIISLVWPRHIGHADAIRAFIRQRRRFGANQFSLLRVLQATIGTIDAAGAIHVADQLAVFFRFSFGGVDDGGNFFYRLSADLDERTDLVASLAGQTSWKFSTMFVCARALPRLCLFADGVLTAPADDIDLARFEVEAFNIFSN